MRFSSRVSTRVSMRVSGVRRRVPVYKRVFHGSKGVKERFTSSNL